MQCRLRGEGEGLGGSLDIPPPKKRTTHWWLEVHVRETTHMQVHPLTYEVIYEWCWYMYDLIWPWVRWCQHLCTDPNKLFFRYSAPFVNFWTLTHISKWHLKHRPAILNVSVFMYLQGSIHTKGNLDRETKDHLTFVAKVVDGRIPERTAYTVVSIILQTGFFFSVLSASIKLYGSWKKCLHCG